MEVGAAGLRASLGEAAGDGDQNQPDSALLLLSYSSSFSPTPQALKSEQQKLCVFKEYEVNRLHLLLFKLSSGWDTSSDWKQPVAMAVWSGALLKGTFVAAGAR